MSQADWEAGYQAGHAQALTTITIVCNAVSALVWLYVIARGGL